MIKKIFYVQSPIALLVAKKIISTFQYDTRECLFIYGRNMKPTDSNIMGVLWDDFVQQYSWNFIKGIKNFRKSKKAVDELLSINVPESFSLYTSSYSFWFLKYLAQHPKCENYSFMEEGTGSLLTKKERTKIQNAIFFSSRIFYLLKVLLSHNLTYFPNPFIIRSLFKTSKAIFTFSESGFSDYANRYQIDPPFQKVESLKNIKAVFAPTYLIENGAIPKDTYFKAMRKIFDHIVLLGEHTIHYKFHPQHLIRGEHIEDYKKLFFEFSDKIEFIELHPSTSLENIAFTSKPTFYVDISSVALYALSCGSKIISYCDILIQYQPSFKKFPLPQKLNNLVFPGNLLNQISN